MGYEGTFFVQAPEFDDVGYFTTVNDAECYIQMNWWGEVKENPEDWEEEDEDGQEKD